jgi:hypothetical protein
MILFNFTVKIEKIESIKESKIKNPGKLKEND